MNKIKLLSLAGLLASASPAFATMPPAPGNHTITVADGSQQQVTIHGQFGLHWYETTDGAAIMRDPQRNNDWYYAELNQYDSLSPIAISDTLVSFNSHAPQASYFDASNLPIPVNHHALKQAEYSKAQFQQSVKAKQASTETLLQRQAIKARTATSRNAQVEQPLLVVQVSFTDQVMVHDFTQRIFASNGQSTVDYFLKNSFNRYKVVPAQESEGDINDGVINVSVNQRHPNCNDDALCSQSLNSVFQEAYTQLDPYINLAQYDSNSDGQIAPDELSVMFIFAGNDMSGSTITPAIWPHKSQHDNATLDNVTINQYCLFGDFQNDHQSTLGVIVHELGHLMLGLPDLYSYYGQGSIGEWGLMAGGSWAQKPGDLYPGDTPVNMTTWSQQAAGFLTPRVLNSTGAQEINTLDGGAIVYLDPYLKTAGPRLYIENRRKQGYDQALPAEGVLITSVDIRQPFNDFSPMQVQVLQADNRNQLSSRNGRSDAGDIYPGATNNTFVSDFSAPSLIGVTGLSTDVILDGISSTADVARFNLNKQSTGNKTAWYTSFERNYLYSNHGLNTVAFEVEADEAFNQLAGFMYYTIATSTQPLEVKLSRYPYANTPYYLDLTGQAEELIWQGQVNSANGRQMLEAPFNLPAGKSILVLEVTNGELELTPVYANNYTHRLYTLPTNWIGRSAELNNGNLAQHPFATVPFAALLEANSSSFVEARDDSYQLDEDTSLTLDLLSNDFIQIGYPQRELRVLTPPSKGSFDPITGIYQARDNLNGIDTFTYQVELSNGISSNEASVTLEINGINDAPMANNDSYQQQENSQRKLDVLDNDSDVDGDNLVITRIVSAPQHGQAQVVGSQIEFNSQLSKPLTVGTELNDSFSYEITDSNGAVGVAQVQVVILGPKPTLAPTSEPTPEPSVVPATTLTPIATAEPSNESKQGEIVPSSSGGGGGSLGLFSLLGGLIVYRLRQRSA
ncbi:M6 family metalloprotease domain-containing protein [Motilimonas cestriensis]|uniref:M6 family metalloprotease domain-containing protein n=1 Tax=Motilimonas cestriensis TaxID=2742685 RepID=UPI003DA62AA9